MTIDLRCQDVTRCAAEYDSCFMRLLVSLSRFRVVVEFINLAYGVMCFVVTAVSEKNVFLAGTLAQTTVLVESTWADTCTLKHLASGNEWFSPLWLWGIEHNDHNKLCTIPTYKICIIYSPVVRHRKPFSLLLYWMRITSDILPPDSVQTPMRVGNFRVLQKQPERIRFLQKLATQTSEKHRFA